MRTSLLVAFLFFSILISHVQGIRLNKGIIISHEDHLVLQKGVVTRTTSENGADVEAVKLQDEHQSGGIRKLISKITSNIPSFTSKFTSKKEGNNKPKASGNKLGFGAKDESLSIDSKVDSEHRYTTSERYPDVIDLTGMDYSPAKRKPPIHN